MNIGMERGRTQWLLQDKTIIGYRSKVMTDPTGDPHAEFQIRHVYESEIENEKKIVQEGKLSET
jgi:hypothetical protein